VAFSGARHAGSRHELSSMILNAKSRAVLYVRASTEHQNYSTRHHEAALRHYASQHGQDIVRVYRDEGRTGLTLK